MSTRSGAIFDVAGRRITIEELNQQRLDPSFWDNPDRAREVEKRIAREQEWVEAYEDLKERVETIETLQLLEIGRASCRERVYTKV